MEHLQKLSEELVQLSGRAANWVVRVNGRRGPNATGILWSKNLVVTSHRACHREQEIEIGLPDGRVVTGTVLGRAPDYDLAAVQLSEELAGYRPLPWADSWSPGLVMALARDRNGSLLSKLGLIAGEELVHRIAPAPEFLGSPLVDSQGRFQGVHLMAGHPRVVSQKELDEMLRRVLESGNLEPAFLGLGLHRVETPEGYRCLAVKVEGPAREAGVMIGDQLLAVSDTRTSDPQQVREVLRGLAAGGSVTLKLLRGARELELDATLGVRPESGFPRKFKKHIKRVIQHLHHHHGPGHHPPPGHHHGPHHPEEPELC